MREDTNQRPPSLSAPFPPYSYVPGGPWPHPISSPLGHSFGRRDGPILAGSDVYRERIQQGAALFNAGYYWEAHEAWEGPWHAEGRRGPIAELLKGLIKLAAAGVKVRERRPSGVRTHAARAEACFAAALEHGGDRQLGLGLHEWIERARAIADRPPDDPGPPGAPVTRVFEFRVDGLEPA